MKAKKLNKRVMVIAQFRSTNTSEESCSKTVTGTTDPTLTTTGGGDPTTTTITVVTTGMI